MSHFQTLRRVKWHRRPCLLPIHIHPSRVLRHHDGRFSVRWTSNPMLGTGSIHENLGEVRWNLLLHQGNLLLARSFPQWGGTFCCAIRDCDCIPGKNSEIRIANNQLFSESGLLSVDPHHPFSPSFPFLPPVNHLENFQRELRWVLTWSEYHLIPILPELKIKELAAVSEASRKIKSNMQDDLVKARKFGRYFFKKLIFRNEMTIFKKTGSFVASGRFLPTLFLLVKALYLANVVFQFWILSYFLETKSWLWGLHTFLVSCHKALHYFNLPFFRISLPDVNGKPPESSLV